MGAILEEEFGICTDLGAKGERGQKGPIVLVTIPGWLNQSKRKICASGIILVRVQIYVTFLERNYINIHIN